MTWHIEATRRVVSTGQLIVNGVFRVDNKGSAPASIGNIVVNLQTPVSGNSWVTRASDIAGATQDDAVTRAVLNPKAKVSSEDLGEFSEGPGSGSLLCTNATTNSTFALKPQATIAPRSVQALRFSVI